MSNEDAVIEKAEKGLQTFVRTRTTSRRDSIYNIPKYLLSESFKLKIDVEVKVGWRNRTLSWLQSSQSGIYFSAAAGLWNVLFIPL
jgi:hypothetical protein